jgi:preprotein translocase subunit SecG
MVIALTIIHVIVCFFLVIVVLLQSGKAADLAGAFGGMGSQTAFGPRGATTVLSKATTIAAAVFMITSLTLAILATRNAGGSQTILDKSGKPTTSAPAQGNAPGGIKVTTEQGGKTSTTTVPINIPGQAPSQPAPAQTPAPAKK